MPVTSYPNTFAVHQAAQALGVGVHSIRRWCEYHSDHLSAGARPPTGQARRLTGRDIEVLRTVRDLRAQGMTTQAINERLVNMAFADVDTTAITPASQEGPETGLQVLQHLDSVLRPIAARLDAQDKAIEEMKSRQRSVFTAFGAGVLVASVFFLLIVLLIRLGG